MNLEEYKEALLSNKDDTSFLIGELGELSEKAKVLEYRIEKLEKQNFNSFIFTTVAITVFSGAIAGIGGYEISQGNAKGWDYLKASGIIFLGAQLVYQGGHWIFKWY